MEISSLSSGPNTLAQMADSLQSSQFGLELSAAVLKQILKTQDQQAEAVLKMMRQSSLDGTGQRVNIQV